MGMVVLLLGGQEIDFKMGAGWICKFFFTPPLFSPGFQLVSPQSHPFTSSLTDCDGVVYRPKKLKGGELVKHQSSTKDHKVEGLGHE